jgi:hypothetical protein
VSTEAFAMWPPHEAFYLRSMLVNASSALDSIERVSDVVDAVNELSDDEMRRTVDSTSLLNELQNIVLQAGALSRYFWPSGKKPQYIARGEHLRSKFAVTDQSPLFSRDLRNSLEHFDERLDDYFRGNIVGVILPEYVGRRPTDEQIPYHLFRAYFVDDGIFALLDEEYAISPIADEILRIHKHLRFQADIGDRLRPPVDSSSSNYETPSDY